MIFLRLPLIYILNLLGHQIDPDEMAKREKAIEEENTLRRTAQSRMEQNRQALDYWRNFPFVGHHDNSTK